MNKKLSITFLILIIAPFVFGCNGPVTAENNNKTSASSAALGQKYSIDPKETVVTWKGSMVIASEEEHTGYVYLSKGDLMIDKGQLVGGTFEIDMNTIEYKDREHKNSPVFHLKSPDYFDVKKFPIATFVITRVTSSNDKNMQVTGNLTIKEVTNEVSFPAKIDLKDGIVKANGKLVIDRTDWGIRYRSGKFYDVVADQIVSDDVEFLMNIVAKKPLMPF